MTLRQTELQYPADLDEPEAYRNQRQQGRYQPSRYHERLPGPGANVEGADFWIGNLPTRFAADVIRGLDQQFTRGVDRVAR